MFNTSYDVLEYILLWWTGFRRCNQNPYTKEEQTKQWQKEKVQRAYNDLQNIYIKLKIE